MNISATMTNSVNFLHTFSYLFVLYFLFLLVLAWKLYPLRRMVLFVSYSLNWFDGHSAIAGANPASIPKTINKMQAPTAIQKLI